MHTFLSFFLLFPISHPLPLSFILHYNYNFMFPRSSSSHSLILWNEHISIIEYIILSVALLNVNQFKKRSLPNPASLSLRGWVVAPIKGSCGTYGVVGRGRSMRPCPSEGVVRVMIAGGA